MRILIIEDEIIIARFIENQIKESFQAKTHIALNVNEAENAINHFLPQLVLCDIELNDRINGIELMQILKKRYGFELVFITSFQSMTMINKAFELKPANYIIKPLDEYRLYAGILPVMKKLFENADNPEIHLNNVLSPTEILVLQLIAQRKTTKEIAESLFLSPYTIKNHRHGICRKLGLGEENNALLMWALKNQQVILR